MPAVAVTDTNNLFGAYEISGALAQQGIQPITGVTLAVAFPDDLSTPVRHAPGEHSYPSVALLVKDADGYVQLSKLISSAYTEVAAEEAPHATLDRLIRYSQGLVLLTGGPDGPVNRMLAAGQPEAAERLLDHRLTTAFGDRLYIELQRHGLPNEAAIEDRLVALAYEKGLPLVATNDAHFATDDMYEASDALLCIAGGTFIDIEDRRRLTREHRFKPADEMAALFSDLPEALANTIEIPAAVAHSGRANTRPSCRNSFPNRDCRPKKNCAPRPKPALASDSTNMDCSRTKKPITTGSIMNWMSSREWAFRDISSSSRIS